MNKKATVYILNVSHAMSQYPDHAFSKAQKTILDTLQDRALAGRKTDLATVLLCGTPETQNMLQKDGYQHIYALTDALDKPDPNDPAGKKRLPYPDSELIRTFANVTTSKDTDKTADVLDALIVAISMINETCRDLKYKRSIKIFTDNQNKINWDDLDAVAEMLRENKKETELIVAGVDYDELDSPDCSEIVKENYENWQKLIEKAGTGGQIISVQEAYEIGQSMFAPEVTPRYAYNGYLYLGNPHTNEHYIGIHVYTYLRTTEKKMPSNHKWSGHSEGPTHEVTSSSKYLLDVRDEDSGESKEQEVEKKDLRSGYKFGKSMVIVTDEEQNALKLETKKEMTIIGFLDASEFPRHYFYSNAYILTAGKTREDEAARALNAFAHAMFMENCYALVRFVPKDNGQPKMGVLVPLLDEESVVSILQYFDAPFADDVRDYKFRSIKKTKSLGGDDYDIMEAIVDSMSLDAFGDDYLAPESNYNPLIWRMNTAIKNRALNSASAVPEFDERFRPQFEVAEEIKRKVSDLGEEASKHFNVKKVRDKGKKRAYSHMDSEATQDSEVTAIEDILSTAVSDARKFPNMDTDITPLIQKTVKTINLVTPVEDFHAMINSVDDEEDMVEKAVKDMHFAIFKLLRSSFKNQHYSKVLDCLKALREAAAKEDEASSFNHTIQEVKSWCNISVKEDKGEPNPRLELWEMIKSANLGLITNEECQDTDIRDVTEEVAEKFWQEDQEEKPKDVADDDDGEEDYEDLF